MRGAVAALGLLVCLPLGLAEWRTPSALALAQMIVNGAVVAAATVALAEAFRHANAARLAPFGYSGLVWSLTFDLAIWGQVPAWLTLAGALIVVAACLLSERAASRR
jgi:drug/metabolite transporter (DMT)-like permease